MLNHLIIEMQKRPERYVGTFSFTYNSERITQVLMFGKHVDSILCLGK